MILLPIIEYKNYLDLYIYISLCNIYFKHTSVVQEAELLSNSSFTGNLALGYRLGKLFRKTLDSSDIETSNVKFIFYNGW